jgi:hypothetical protein
LHKFIRELGHLQNLRLLPEVQIVREHDPVVLAILARQHHVLSIDLSREQGHPLALYLGSVQRNDLEREEVTGLNELRQDRLSIVRGIGGVVGHRAIVIDETYKTGILDSLALGF